MGTVELVHLPLEGTDTGDMSGRRCCMRAIIFFHLRSEQRYKFLFSIAIVWGWL